MKRIVLHRVCRGVRKKISKVRSDDAWLSDFLICSQGSAVFGADWRP